VASTMHVEVVSAEKQLLSADITGLFARSVEGEIGILPGHQPALIALDIAPIVVHLEDGGEERIAVHNGFLYVDRDKVIVLADIAELASQIDVERAQRRRQQLEGRTETAEHDAAVQASLRKQQLRLDLAGRG
jgi:F-type H+-transporting ATPase subunit epsilon